MITSVTLGGLEIGNSAAFAILRESLPAIKAGVPREPRMVKMAARHPEFIDTDPQARSITLVISLLAKTYDLRGADFDDLVAAAGDGSVLVPLTWTENAVVRTYQVHCSGPVDNGWYYRATVACVAPDPVAV